MKKRLQPVERVEIAVMRSLQTSLKPKVGVDDLLTYVKQEVDPNEYSSREAFLADYVCSSFLRKWKGFKHNELNPEWAAFSTWTKSERQCFVTNKRLSHEASTGSYSVAPAAIVAAQRQIASVLGRLDMHRIAELCRFGNGATFDLRRGATHADKSSRPSVTFDAIPWACRVLTDDVYLGSLVGPLSGLKIVEANRMVMVPKTVKTHRPIAAEPTLNSYVQQGFGRYIRLRLKQFGVDLGDQTINQDYARRALADGLSTIDLSSASDTLCVNLVKLLLPREWFEALDDLRCKYTIFKGRRFKLSKFSSMGNAFTFELESLIFKALIDSVCTGHVSSVYGDDLIVENCDYRSTLEILTWAGFTINEEKSFTEGSRFYESCGKHYFEGTEVTPCFQKDVVHRPHDYVRLHNRLVRAGARLGLRKEFGAAARIVLDECRAVHGERCPGVGPPVEYDEYFIRLNYVWAKAMDDRVRIRSAVVLPVDREVDMDWRVIAYYGRKLRSPGFLNSGRRRDSLRGSVEDGTLTENLGSKLLVIEKYHWRSAVKEDVASHEVTESFDEPEGSVAARVYPG
jgi:hypothetical protein